MTASLALLQFALLAGFCLATALALLIAAGERTLQRVLARQAPARRARVIWWMLAAPAVCGLGYALLTFATPAVLHGSAGFAAACSGHGGSLWHACVWHPSAHGDSPWVWAAMVALLGHAAWLAGRALRGAWRARRSLATLLRLSQRRSDTGVHVIDTEQPLAVACGFARGEILLSRALVERLDRSQLAVVLAHEAAHVAHRDPLWRVAARVLSGLHLPHTRRRLLAALELATEQRCDRVAADAVGSRVTVAATIVAVERIFRGEVHPLQLHGAGFVTSFVPERVQALLASEVDPRLRVGLPLAAALVMFCVSSTGWLHHLTESLVALLAW